MCTSSTNEETGERAFQCVLGLLLPDETSFAMQRSSKLRRAWPQMFPTSERSGALPASALFHLSRSGSKVTTSISSLFYLKKEEATKTLRSIFIRYPWRDKWRGKDCRCRHPGGSGKFVQRDLKEKQNFYKFTTLKWIWFRNGEVLHATL